MRRIWFALSVATAGLILGGTGSTALADDSSAAANAKEKQEIQTQLENAPDLKDYHITVKVDDGIAVLEGTVDSIWEKKEAQRLAHVDGILGVNNRLELRSSEK
jgi:osmotically-inducible protein OsmY